MQLHKLCYADNRKHAVVTTKTTKAKSNACTEDTRTHAQRKEQLVIVVYCEGGDVRVSAAIDDRNEALWGIVPNVMTC